MLGRQQFAERQAVRAGNVPAAQAGTRLGRARMEAVGRARIEQQLAARVEIVAHVAQAAQQAGAKRTLEPSRCRARLWALLQRVLLGAPLWQATVQHRHLIVPEQAQHPPGARRGEQAELVVADDAAVAGDAERAICCAKYSGLGTM